MHMCHIQPSKGAKVAFVFACPGRHEEKAGYPCAGATGVNLDSAIQRLHALRSDIFTSPDRKNYLITNAWSTVEYNGKTQRSLPTILEVLSRSNINRLARELADIELVIACGEHAVVAVTLCQEYMGLTSVSIHTCHLGQRAINRLGSTNSARVNKWAQDVVREL